MYTPEDKLKKLKTFTQNPDLAKYNELQGIVESLHGLNQSIVPLLGNLKGEKGDKGDPGESIVGPAGPAGQDSKVAGPKGDPGKPGKDGKDGKPGKDGKDGLDGKDGIGKDGLNGSPDTGMDIVDKINELDTKPENQIDASHIKNLPKVVNTLVGGTSGVKGLTAGNHNIVIDDDPVLAGHKRITFTPDITVSLTAPSNPYVTQLWYDIN